MGDLQLHRGSNTTLRSQRDDPQLLTSTCLPLMTHGFTLASNIARIRARGKLAVQLEPDGSNACDKGEPWQQSLPPPSETRKVKSDPEVLSYSMYSDHGVREGRTAETDSGSCEKLEAKLEPEAQPAVITCSAGIRACEKNVQRQAALAPCEKQEAKLKSETVSQNAGNSACEKSEPWQQSPPPLSGMWKAKTEPEIVSYRAGIRVCEQLEAKLKSDGSSVCGKGEPWQQPLPPPIETWKAKLEPEAIIYTACDTSQLQCGDPCEKEGSGNACGHCGKCEKWLGVKPSRAHPTTPAARRGPG